MPPGTCSFPPHPPSPMPGALPPSSSSLVLSVVPPDHLPMQRLSVPPGVPAGRSISHTSALPSPSTAASAALFAGLPPWNGHGILLALLHRPPCWLPSTPGRLCAWTTVSSRPAKEDPLTLRELLGWFSGASKSSVGHPGDPHRAAPQECCWMPSHVLPSCRGSRALG